MAAAKKKQQRKPGEKQQIWERENPGKRHAELTETEKAEAKKNAEKSGRSTPSLADNINAERTGEQRRRKRKKS